MHTLITFIVTSDNLIGFMVWHSISKTIWKRYTYGSNHSNTT
jgi:hypothetical protein